MKNTGVLLTVGVLAFLLYSQIATDHVDTTRQGWYQNETILTPSNVVTGFGKLGKYTLDGPANAQPLVIHGVTIDSQAYDVLLVATMGNSLYAFDANNPGAAALWHTNFGTPNSSYPNISESGNTLLWGVNLGCLSTPAVDVANALVYAVCSDSTQTWTLRKIDLTSGSVLASQTISGQVTGTGDPTGGDTTSGSNVVFYPRFELQRMGLTLANGNVYFGFGSYGDIHPWHGWAFAYDASSLSQVGIFCTSPNTFGAGIWGSGGGFAVDPSGNLIALTGNGPFDNTTGAYGESVIKLGSTLSLVDYFTPSNWSTLNTNDQDLSSGRGILVPGTTYAIAGAKDYNVYVVNTACMGHLGGTANDCTAPSLLTTGTVINDQHHGIYGGLFFNGLAFFPNTAGHIYSFTQSGHTFTAATTSSATFEFPGATMAASSNGTSNGIIWAVTTSTSGGVATATTGTLRALNPSDLTEYWNSDGRTVDNVGTISKFASPTIYNGKVFVATQDNSVEVFGLTSSSSISGTVSLSGGASLQ